MSTIVLLVVLVVIALWVIGAYNGLISLKNQVANAWKQIDVQLKRRHDLIPNLVNTVKGAMDFERGTLEAVIAARNKAVSATGVKDKMFDLRPRFRETSGAVVITSQLIF